MLTEHVARHQENKKVWRCGVPVQRYGKLGVTTVHGADSRSLD